MARVRPIGQALTGVPTGGPYTIALNRPGREPETIGPVFVGDLWLLAGQSNMEGYGNLDDVAPPNDRVMLLGMNGSWSRAEEPLHWLVDSPDSVHSGDPATRAARAEQAHKARSKGAGLGLPFAAALVEMTDVPIGLIAAAHGGTSLEQWDPALKDKGGASLYGSMLDQFRRAGGKVRGVLWYQGESDAMNPMLFPKYEENFKTLIAAIRSDFGDPELPFHFAQLGRFVSDFDPRGWSAVQDIQRRLPARLANTWVVTTIDAELDDPIHIGTQGLKRVGKRFARQVAHDLHGRRDGTTPTFDTVTRGNGNTLRVRFRGVNVVESTTAAREGTEARVVVRGAELRDGQRRILARVGLPEGTTRRVGLRPESHVFGFSIRDADGRVLPRIYDARVDPSEPGRDVVILDLAAGTLPQGATLWYGGGLDPTCNLTDALDMAVPVFGPIPLDGV